ncbi:MAG: PQQ-binding-like beta-propeller repeat protein, partial [Pseudomonadota bacterium]|nr:PQQ-binding-like beta-propeller repeat protein [Pseudomonadota bacterium]
NGGVAALDAESGEPLWEKDLDLEVSAPPVIASGIVAVRTSDGSVIGLDEISGDEVWRYQRSVPGLTLRGDAPMVVVANGLLTGFANGKLVASDLESGRVFWEKVVSLARGRNEIERLNDVDAPPLVAERDIYVSTYRGGVLAMGAEDARDIWQAPVSTRRAMDADRRQLYITNELGSVIALDRESGEPVWQQDALQGHGVSGPVLFDIYLAVGTLDGVVYLLDPDDGSLAGKSPAVGGSVIAMRANSDRLLVASSEGEVAALSFTY